MISRWLEAAARDTNEALIRLDSALIIEIVARIRVRFTEQKTRSNQLWEDFVDDASTIRNDGWRVACEYPEQHPIILFRDSDAYEGYIASSPQSLERILAESPGFEFFLTNEDVDYVLCFNHHNYLIGVGQCKDWLSHIAS